MWFPNRPHVIIELNNSEYKPYEVRTDHGYSPIECYYKIIKKEKRIKEYKESPIGFKYKKYDEWVEI